MSKYQALANFLEHACQQYNLQLCFNDFSGFIAIDKQLDQVLQPFMAHTNPYCMYLKSNRGVYGQCLALKKKIAEKSIKLQSPFYGICHAGVGEYIIPIDYQGNLLGVINVGVFQIEADLATYLVRKVCKRSGLSEEVAKELYFQSLTQNPPSLKTITDTFAIIADYLGDIHSIIQSSNSGLKPGKKRYYSSEDSILAHILDYIKQNYREPLTVEEISNFCHCSESYVNHLFKKRVGINIKMYINKIRVEQARTQLVESGGKVAEIAYTVGFNDSNYFSRVFTELTGISPLEYRRRFS